MLSKRVISAAVMIPIVALVVYVGGISLLATIALVGCLAMYEYLTMMKAKGAQPSLVLGMVLVLALLADAQWPKQNLLLPMLTVLTCAELARQVFRKNVPGSLDSWALLLAGGLYVGLTLGYFVRLRALTDGIMWLVLALVGTWVCDSGAYFVGVSMGRNKLAPQISPKKSWEGAIGGLVFGIAATLLAGHFLLHLALWQGLVIGVGVVAAATIGDLAESVIKRQIGVKDSSHLIPGHGGMLDRIDSLLFVVPFVYYCALWFS